MAGYSLSSLDNHLDSLGATYVDGVKVRVNPRYQVNVDLSDVERILRQPGPSVLRSDIHYDASKERKVLQDIEKGRKEEEERNEARRLRIQKYDEEIEREKAIKVEEEERLEKERLEQLERQEKERLAEVERIEAEKLRLEEEEKRRRKAEEEAEWSRFSEERWKAVRPEASDPTIQNSSSSEEGEREGFVTPPQQPEPVKKELEVSSDKPFVKGVQSHSGAKINFSDFEAISDPFGDLELKTMDDLAELRTILTTNQQNTNQFCLQRPISPAKSLFCLPHNEFLFNDGLSAEKYFPPRFPHHVSSTNISLFCSTRLLCTISSRATSTQRVNPVHA